MFVYVCGIDWDFGCFVIGFVVYFSNFYFYECGGIVGVVYVFE